MKKSDRSKEHILFIASELFSQNGFELTSTKSLAKEMKVSEGLIFKHFKTKQGLLDAVISKTFKNFKEDSLKVIVPMLSENIDAVSKIKKLIKNRYKFLEDNKSGIAIVFNHALYNENFRNELNTTLIKKVDSILLDLIIQAKKERLINCEYKVDVAISLIKNLLYEMILVTVLFKTEYDIDNLDKKVDTIIKGMN